MVELLGGAVELPRETKAARREPLVKLGARPFGQFPFVAQSGALATNPARTVAFVKVATSGAAIGTHKPAAFCGSARNARARRFGFDQFRFMR